MKRNGHREDHWSGTIGRGPNGEKEFEGQEKFFAAYIFGKLNDLLLMSDEKNVKKRISDFVSEIQDDVACGRFISSLNNSAANEFWDKIWMTFAKSAVHSRKPSDSKVLQEIKNQLGLIPNSIE